MDHLFDTTLYTRINEELEKNFSCTVPFLPTIRSNFTGNISEICNEPNKSMSAVRLYDFLRASGQSNICGTPCEGMDVYLGLPFISKTEHNWGHIKIYLKSTVKIKRTVLDYTFLSLVAEVGGYVGLLLGISVVKLVTNMNSFCTQHLAQQLLNSEFIHQ